MDIADVISHLVENASWLAGDLEKAREAVEAIRHNDKPAKETSQPVSVADQRAGGVSEPVTVADQRQGAPLPDSYQAPVESQGVTY
jgi:hypothetical protein